MLIVRWWGGSSRSSSRSRSRSTSSTGSGSSSSAIIDLTVVIIEQVTQLPPFATTVTLIGTAATCHLVLLVVAVLVVELAVATEDRAVRALALLVLHLDRHAHRGAAAKWADRPAQQAVGVRF
jgi:hypothetical protein